MLFEDIEGWDGVGREPLDKGDVYIHIADSCCHMAETNTTFLSNYPPIKNFLILIIKKDEGPKEGQARVSSTQEDLYYRCLYTSQLGGQGCFS